MRPVRRPAPRSALAAEVPGLVPAVVVRAVGGLALAAAVALVPAAAGVPASVGLVVGLLLGTAAAVRPSALLVTAGLGLVLAGALLGAGGAGGVAGVRLHALVLLVPLALVALRTAADVPARTRVDPLLLRRAARRALVVQAGAQPLAVLAALLGDRPPSTALAAVAVLALGAVAVAVARR